MYETELVKSLTDILLSIVRYVKLELDKEIHISYSVLGPFVLLHLLCKYYFTVKDTDGRRFCFTQVKNDNVSKENAKVLKLLAVIIFRVQLDIVKYNRFFDEIDETPECIEKNLCPIQAYVTLFEDINLLNIIYSYEIIRLGNGKFIRMTCMVGLDLIHLFNQVNT